MLRSGLLLLSIVLHVFVPQCELSDDLIAVDCEPLCQFELLEERWCALQKGCYEPNIKDNDVLFIQCWQQCWRSSTNCLSLCRANHAALKDQCSQQCATSSDKFCPGFCFALEVDKLVHGTQQAGGHGAVKPPGTKPPEEKQTTTVTPTPQGPAVTTPPIKSEEGATTASSSE